MNVRDDTFALFLSSPTMCWLIESSCSESTPSGPLPALSLSCGTKLRNLEELRPNGDPPLVSMPICLRSLFRHPQDEAGLVHRSGGRGGGPSERRICTAGR